MNCPNCGNAIQNGSAFCPICNAPLVQGYSQPAYGYQQPAAPGYVNNGYPQQYNQSAYPTAYQQPRAYAENQPDPLLTTVSELPREFLRSFRSPTETLLSLVEKNDTISAAIVGGIVLLLTFFAGMALSNGMVKMLAEFFARVSGVSLSGVTGSSAQGVNLISERVAASIGGVAVLCQLICMLIPAIVICVYLNIIRKNPFSWSVALSLITVSSFPAVVSAVLCMLASFISPWIAVVIVILATAFSYLQLGYMLNYITGLSEEQMFVSKSVCLLVSLLLSLVAVLLVGGGLMGGIFNHVLRMFSTGSLV